MAPKKKSRSLNGRPLHTNVPSAQKNYRSCKNQKKKLSDKLGPKWSKEEIKCFYEGYRKFGQDWEKVASSIYDRSIEMVEALYNTNKAYLSLPEGTASVVGLTALMTDYYHVMGGSDSERENYDASGFQKLPKTNQGKVKMSVSNEDHLTTHSVTASGGCLSSLRSLYYGDQPRVVGKRTPRFPISCSNTRDEWESRASESKSWQKSEVDVNSDEVEHVAALALTEASQRRGSPSTSVPCKIKENMKSSYEVSGGHKGRPYEEYGCDPNSLVDRECVKTVEAHHKTKKWYRKKKVIDVKNRRSHQNVEYLTENRLETSNMDDLCSLSVPEGNVGTEISNAEYELLSPLVEGKKSRKLLHEDENTALDALQTLVDLSLMMPYTAAESESSAQLVEETESFNLEDKSCIPQATLSARSRDKGKQTMVNAISGIGNTSYMQSKSGRGLSIDVVSKKKKRLEQPDTTWKRKRKLLIPDDTKVHVDVHLCENLKTEDFDCMPSNPMYNLPEALKRQSCSINTLYLECKEPQANMHPNLSRKLEKASSQHTTHGLVPYTTFNLKQHNNFSGYSLPLWLKPQANTSALRSIPCSLNVSQESGCRVADIVNGSREKAQLMVNVAVEVLSSTKEGDDPLTMVWGALHSFDNQISSSGYQKLSIKSQDLMNDNLGHFNQFCSSEHLSASDSSIPSLRHPDQGYAGVPSDLITSCVAALFMIQACIECPYPPGDVAQILGSAVKSLHPRCSQNLHFYKEIETCIGRIKTQLLAIVPT
ncbi:protein ALWAYS EARLY 2-like isoform X6 [Momordica charantia]|uniref:Protein ALWAYS EARLY 2-like isoform X6 n=1 Tax=Momordica charantia TaxID=3673 RepID=A0A6J1DAY2_MOMCH|nr:protein ALWAYS EARLY 2-like isoform X6 [Momordica charantia]